MIVYLDTSAIARYYLPEPFREEMRGFLVQATALVTHSFSQVEVASALAKAHRERRITDGDLQAARHQFEIDWERFDQVMPDDAIAVDATRLIERFVLRAMDAIHIAAAERVRRSVSPDAFAFMSFDVQQNAAASALGMATPQLANQEIRAGHGAGLI